MLIDKTIIAKYREVSRSVRDDKINPHIDDAEFLDLRPLLGRKLLKALEDNKTDGGAYQLLLEGGEYTYDGEDYKQPGVEKVLSLFAYPRYILHGGFTDTAFGFVEKSNQDSTPVSTASKRDIYEKDRNAAMEYWYEVETFLNRMKADYPEWGESSCNVRRTGFRISKIS